MRYTGFVRVSTYVTATMASNRQHPMNTTCKTCTTSNSACQQGRHLLDLLAAYHVELQMGLVCYDPHLLQLSRFDQVCQFQLRKHACQSCAKSATTTSCVQIASPASCAYHHCRSHWQQQQSKGMGDEHMIASFDIFQSHTPLSEVCIGSQPTFSQVALRKSASDVHPVSQCM